jgi:hypothetical protein
MGWTVVEIRFNGGKAQSTDMLPYHGWINGIQALCLAQLPEPRVSMPVIDKDQSLTEFSPCTPPEKLFGFGQRRRFEP